MSEHKRTDAAKPRGVKAKPDNHLVRVWTLKPGATCMTQQRRQFRREVEQAHLEATGKPLTARQWKKLRRAEKQHHAGPMVPAPPDPAEAL